MENEILQQILQELAGMRKEISCLKAIMHASKEDSGALKANMQTVQEDIGGLKSEVKVLNFETHAIKKEIGSMRMEIKKLYSLSNAAFADILNLDDRISGVN